MTEEMRIEGMHCVSCERRITRTLATTYRIDSLCLAGGVALNCVAL